MPMPTGSTATAFAPFLAFLALLALLSLIFLHKLGTLLLMQMLGMAVPLHGIALIIAGTGIAAGLARPVIDAAYYDY